LKINLLLQSFLADIQSSFVLASCCSLQFARNQTVSENAWFFNTASSPVSFKGKEFVSALVLYDSLEFCLIQYRDKSAGFARSLTDPTYLPWCFPILVIFLA
jgi:hypothetical protein